MTELSQHEPLRENVQELCDFHHVEAQIPEPVCIRNANEESAEKYLDLLEQINDIIFRMTLHGVLTEVSPAVTAILGYNPVDVVGKNISQFTSHDVLLTIQEKILQKMRDPDTHSRYEIPIRSLCGEEIFCEVNSRLIRKPGQNPEILGIIRDMTGRRRMEDTIRRSERRFRDIFENAIEGMFQTTLTGSFLNVNASFARMLGYPTPEDLVRDVPDVSRIYPHIEDRIRLIRTLDEQGIVQQVEVKLIHRSGEIRWFKISARLVADESGQYIEGSASDITDEIRLKQSMEERERYYRLLADNSNDVIWTADMEMHLTFMSPSVTRLRGYSVEEAMNQPLHEVYTPESLRTLHEQRSSGLKLLASSSDYDDPPQYLELGMYHRDGRVIWTETVIGLMRDTEKRPVGVMGSTRDITARKQIEAAHQEIESRLQEAQYLAQIGNWELNLQTGLFTCSDEVYRIFERDPAGSRFSFQDFLGFVYPEDLETVTQVYQPAQAVYGCSEAVHRIRLPNEKIKCIQVRRREGVQRGDDGLKIFGTIQDITTRMNLEAEREQLLEQIQRNMAELATLNDGIRNPLTIIETMLDIHPATCHDEVHRQVARIDAMVTQLDRRWCESEKVLLYLRKHYGIRTSGGENYFQQYDLRC